jgi:hypothetical protein
MNCLRAEELLSDHRLGELHPLLGGELREHLSTCAECAALDAALAEVMDTLQEAGRRLQPGEVEPAPDLAARVAAAAWGRPKARAQRAWMTRLPPLQTLAAGLAFLATGTAFAGRMAVQHGWPQRLADRTARAGLFLIERKDRAVEDLRVLRVVMGATFSGRMESVNERVDDYRRLLQRRRAAAPPAPPAAGVPTSTLPEAGPDLRTARLTRT